MQHWYLILLFLAGGLSAQAQPCTLALQGLVLEAGSGLPIPDVMVFIPAVQKGAYTDSAGRFRIADLCPGPQVLVARHLNHDEQRQTITLERTQQSTTLYMTCHTDTLHQATVKGARFHWEDVTVSNRLQGRDLFAGSGQSLGKMLEQVNGVYNLSTGSNISKPMIRGMHSNRVIILNNGLRQEGQQWGNEHAPEIDPFLASDIEVVKGAQVLRYGSDVIGGLILVNPKPMREIGRFGWSLNGSAFSNGRAGALSGSMEGLVKPVRGLSWRVQATLRRAGNNRTPDYFLKNTGMSERNASASFGYRRGRVEAELFASVFRTKIGILSASHIGNLSDLYAAFNRERPLDSSGFSYAIGFPFQDVQHRLGKARAQIALHPKHTLHLLYGVQDNRRREYDRTLQTNGPDGSYRPALDFDLLSQQADVFLEHKDLRRFDGGFGVQAFWQSNEYYGNYFIPNFQKRNGGVYWVEKWHRHAFSLEAGLRYDVQDLQVQKWEDNVLRSFRHRFGGPAASFAARYQWPLFTLHFNLGTAWRAPFVNELYSDGVHHSAATYERGDRTLVPERNLNTSLTLDFNYRKKTDLEFTVFSNLVRDFITLQPAFPAVLTIRGAFPAYHFGQTDARFSGFEFSSTTVLYRSLHLHARANATYARDLSRQTFLVGIPPLRADAELGGKLWDSKRGKLEGSMAGRYTWRQNRVADSADYLPAPPGYFLMQGELTLSTRLAGLETRIQAGVNNALNTRYRDYLNRNRYFADEAGRNVFFRCSFNF
jgi:iron complex outermembrane receptor protein